jgi:hypothetical protein
MIRFALFVIFIEFILMSIGNHALTLIDFLRLPRPQGEQRKSIYSPWGWGK